MYVRVSMYCCNVQNKIALFLIHILDVLFALNSHKFDNNILCVNFYSKLHDFNVTQNCFTILDCIKDNVTAYQFKSHDH